MAENKNAELLAQLKMQKEKMKTIYQHECKENSLEVISLQWDIISGDIRGMLERMKMHNLKAQQLQHSDPQSEKVVVKLIKMLELIHIALKDYCKIGPNAGNHDDGMKSLSLNQPSFGEQMITVKQQLDLLSLEMSKLKSIKDTLDSIYSDHKMKLAAVTHNEDNEDQHS